MLDEYGLTPKQKLLADKYVESGNGLQSALAAYDTEDPNTAGVIASRTLKKANVQAYIQQQCNAVGLTSNSVLARVKQSLDAERTLISPNGDVIGQVPDHNIRLKAAELSIKYVLPEFLEYRRAGGEQAGSRHLHLHNVNESVLKRLASKLDTAE